jgi:hypothetical protein
MIQFKLVTASSCKANLLFAFQKNLFLSRCVFGSTSKSFGAVFLRCFVEDSRFLSSVLMILGLKS